MAYDGSFQPQGKQVFIASATSAPTGIQVLSDANSSSQYLIWNSDTTNDAWIGYGPTAAMATANAVIPTAGNPKASVIVAPHGSVQTFTLPSNTFFSPICTGGTPGIYILPGSGL